MSRAIDMAGRRYANVTGIRKLGACASGDARWEFLCDCGSLFEASGYDVRNGKRTSCPDCSRQRAASLLVKHGRTNTPEFSTWTDIQTRCHNENSTSYPGYGGRGIFVCERWRSSFELFLADMGHRPSPEHSIDRVDNDGNYEPGNCRWATREEQANNKRTNRRIEIEGQTKNLSEWATLAGVTPSCILRRIHAGKAGKDLIAPRYAGPREYQKKGSITFGGVTDTYAGWSERTGIKESTIAMRLTKYGWPLEEALTRGSTRCVS